MNALTRWNPFKDLDELESPLSTFFVRTPLRRQNGEQESMTIAEWSPLVDITEDDKEYLIKTELPEVKKDDVKVTVENGVLTITGERKFEKEEKGRKYHRVERAYGNFTRSFSLPEAIKGEKVTAEFRDGMLFVHLPKDETAKPKAIDIKVN